MVRFTGLSWDPGFRAKTERNFNKAQKYVDSECLRFCSPYVPFRTGTMEKSGHQGTVLGSGEVKYTAPYAKRQYYTNAGRGQEGTAKGGKRGKYFLERMKADHLHEIKKGLKENFK